MTPTPDAVKTSYSALDDLLSRVRVTGIRKEIGDTLVESARAELSALRRGVSVEEAGEAYAAAFRRVTGTEGGSFMDGHIAGIKAVLALGETGKGVKRDG